MRGSRGSHAASRHERPGDVIEHLRTREGVPVGVFSAGDEYCPVIEDGGGVECVRRFHTTRQSKGFCKRIKQFRGRERNKTAIETSDHKHLSLAKTVAVWA